MLGAGRAWRPAQSARIDCCCVEREAVLELVVSGACLSSKSPPSGHKHVHRQNQRSGDAKNAGRVGDLSQGCLRSWDHFAQKDYRPDSDFITDLAELTRKYYKIFVVNAAIYIMTLRTKVRMESLISGG